MVLNFQVQRDVQLFGIFDTLRWRHNDHAGVSNHQPHGCLLNRFFRRRSKKTSKLLVTGLCVGNSPGPVNSPHKGPVTRKMFPFDDVIMSQRDLQENICCLFAMCLLVAKHRQVIGHLCTHCDDPSSGLGPCVRTETTVTGRYVV